MLLVNKNMPSLNNIVSIFKMQVPSILWSDSFSVNPVPEQTLFGITKFSNLYLNLIGKQCTKYFQQQHPNKLVFIILCLMFLLSFSTEMCASFNKCDKRDCPPVHGSSHQCLRLPCRG